MSRVPKAPTVVLCPYCGAGAALMASSADVYHGRDYGPLWACMPCGAWVGCHKGTDRPLGRLANKELREWKVKAHAAFDPLWKRKLEKRRQERGADYPQGAARGSGYKWLAEQLGIPQKDCHVGLFDVEMCKRVVKICTPYARKLAA
jgi:zinc-finger-containing domain